MSKQVKMPGTPVSDAERMQQIHDELAEIEREGSEMAQREATPREIADLNVRRAKLQAERGCIVYRRTHPRTADATLVQADADGKLQPDASKVFEAIEQANEQLRPAGLPLYGTLIAALADVAKKVPFCPEQDAAARLVEQVQAAGGVPPLTDRTAGCVSLR